LDSISVDVNCPPGACLGARGFALAAADMVRFATEFRLTAVARSRLAAGVYDQPASSKFDGLMGGPQQGERMPSRWLVPHQLFEHEASP